MAPPHGPGSSAARPGTSLGFAHPVSHQGGGRPETSLGFAHPSSRGAGQGARPGTGLGLGKRGGSSLGHYGASRPPGTASTGLPPRPDSSASFGQSQERWQTDSKWPVCEGDPDIASGRNSSLDVDLLLTRETLYAHIGDLREGESSRQDAAVRSLQEIRKATASPTPATLSAVLPSLRPASKQGRLRTAPGECASIGSARGPTPTPGSARGPTPTPRAPTTPALERRSLSVRHTSAEQKDGTSAGAVASSASRAADVRRSFRYTRSQIEERLELLDTGVFSARHRTAVYDRREDVPEMHSYSGRLWGMYEQTGLSQVPLAADADNLDGWASWEGGCSKSCEVMAAFEVLNFYRWLCGAPRLQLDSFRQELVDMLLQSLTKRDSRVSLSTTAMSSAVDFGEALPEFVAGEGSRALVISHVPGAVAAVRLLLAGLPYGGGGALAATTLHRVGRSQRPHLPSSSEDALEAYFPFLNLTGEPELWSPGTSQQEAPPMGATGGFRETARALQGRVHPSVKAVRRVQMPSLETEVVAEADDGSLSQPRKTRAWGDQKGEVAFRRCVLDPRLRSTGILRRGCRTCFWGGLRLAGEPPLLEPEDGDEPLGEQFLPSDSAEKVDAEKAKTTGSEALARLHAWREQISKRLEAVAESESEEVAAFAADPFSAPPMAGPLMTWDERTILDSPDRGQREIGPETPSREKYLRRIEEKLEHNLCGPASDVAEVPLMVCFPCPGIVPIELMEAAHMPWTISPDALRLVPTSECLVHIHRVKIDVAAGVAERLPQPEVALASFCVDCSDIGNPFCVVFTLAEKVATGDQFEVVLTGLAHPDRGARPGAAAEDFQYFLSFEAFRPSLCDLAPLRQRVGPLATGCRRPRSARALLPYRLGVSPAPSCRGLRRLP